MPAHITKKVPTDISFATINQIYPEMTEIKVGEHTVRVGGLSSAWNVFNEKDEVGACVLPKKIADSTSFAELTSSGFRPQKESPWKIHLSINHYDLGTAWNLIYPILLESKIPHFKVTRPAVSQVMLDAMNKADEAFLQRQQLGQKEREQALRDILRVFHGMQITIYIPAGQEQQYNKILARVEPLLYKAGIRPGIIDKSDRAIGLYSSVRHVGNSYTSHEKVAAYRTIGEMDPFAVIEPVLANVGISWGGLYYKGHLKKVRDLLQHIVDAERNYKQGMQTKKEFFLVCDVALEYFTRWQQLLAQVSPQELEELSVNNRLSFNKLKEKIHHGVKLIPQIKKNKVKKIREAEDILSSSRGMNTLAQVNLPLLQRGDGRRHFKQPYEETKKSEQDEEELTTKSGTQTPAIRKTSSIVILKELFKHRKKTFKELPRKPSGSLDTGLPPEDIVVEPKTEPEESTTLVDPEGRIALQITTELDLEEIEDRGELETPRVFAKPEIPQRSLNLYWTTGGGIIGALFGLAIGFIFALPMLAIIALVVAGGVTGVLIAGGASYFFAEKADSQVGTKSKEPPLLSSTDIMPSTNTVRVEPIIKSDVSPHHQKSEGSRMFPLPSTAKKDSVTGEKLRNLHYKSRGMGD